MSSRLRVRVGGGALVLWLGLGLGLGLGCGGPQERILPDGPLVDAQGAGFDPRTPLQPGEDRGPLERQEVDAVLAAGPQAFISQLKVTPALLAGKFIGFRLEEFFTQDPRYRKVDLFPGDIVTRINGTPVEQPDQFMKIWENMKTATELRVEYLRGGSYRVLRWEIKDSRAMVPTLVR